MSDPFVSIYTAHDMMTAEIVKGLLNASEIPVELAHESLNTVYGFTMGQLGAVEILVPKAFEAQAREVVREMESGELENQPPVSDEPEATPKE